MYFKQRLSENEEKFFYIDWRDSFGDSIDSGDVYYDLSKMYGVTQLANERYRAANIFIRP